VLFAAGDDMDFVEERPLAFEITTDGEYHTYPLDMSSVDTLAGYRQWVAL
jgi:hypothetical protein